MWIVLGVCAAVFVMAVVVAGSFNLFSSGMPEPADRRPARQLPPDFDLDDVDRIAFHPALRGYRMDEVDAVIADLSHRIRAQEQRLRELQPAGGANVAGGMDAAGGAGPAGGMDAADGSNAAAPSSAPVSTAGVESAGAAESTEDEVRNGADDG